MRTLFFGTPQIALPALYALHETTRIVGVVCQPDRPRGRGMYLMPPPIKEEAQKLGLEVYQPEKVRDGSLLRYVQEKDVDLALVIAYGRILTKDVLDTPRLGCLNLHASLLPKYRGAAPIQHALLAGEKETGVCLMQMDEGMDTGDVLARRVVTIEEDDNHGSLLRKLSAAAGKMTRYDLPKHVAGKFTAEPQDNSQATYAPPISREDSNLDFMRDARLLHAQVRAFGPQPGATCLIDQGSKAPRRLKILSSRARTREEFAEAANDAPTTFGGVVVNNQRIFVLCGAGNFLEILEAQPEGKKPQPAAALVNGRVLQTGSLLKQI